MNARAVTGEWVSARSALHTSLFWLVDYAAYSARLAKLFITKGSALNWPAGVSPRMTASPDCAKRLR